MCGTLKSVFSSACSNHFLLSPPLPLSHGPERGKRPEFGLDFNPELQPQGKRDLFRFLRKKSLARKGKQLREAFRGSSGRGPRGPAPKVLGERGTDRIYHLPAMGPVRGFRTLPSPSPKQVCHRRRDRHLLTEELSGSSPFQDTMLLPEDKWTL